MTGLVKNAPGSTHNNPVDYSLIEFGVNSYGLFDLDIAQEVEYRYKYKDKKLTIENMYGRIIKEIKITNNSLTIFRM